MFIYIYRFLCGYIRIRIFGDYPERFLNICAFNSIQLWNIRKLKDCILANVSVKDYLRIRDVKKNRNIHVRITAKRGLYFKLKPYFARKGIAVGIVMFFSVMVFLSGFIWNIDVVGNKTLSREDILDYCEEIGIKEGTIAASIDTNSARLELLMKNPNLSWASFIVEGSHLTVNISETQMAPVKDTAPSNLIAEKDGVIEKVTVSSGKAVVKLNQAVLKGDLLATGALEYSNGTTHFVRCAGEVLAKTEKTIICETPLTIKKTAYTDRTARGRVLTFFGFKIPLSFTPIDFDYSKSILNNRLTKGNAYSPIYITEINYKEKKTSLVSMSQSEAIKYAEKQLEKKEKTEMENIKILSHNDKIILENDVLVVERTYRCIENIAVQEKIKINNVN